VLRIFTTGTIHQMWTYSCLCFSTKYWGSVYVLQNKNLYFHCTEYWL